MTISRYRLMSMIFGVLSLVWLMMLAPLTPARAADAPEPRVTTHSDHGRTVREYRLNHHLYAIEIINDDSAITLIDNDGDGNFQRIADNGEPPVPEWVTND